MRTPLEQLKKELASQTAALATKDAAIKEDENIQDDTEWVNDYHNTQGWVEALGYAVGLLEEAEKKPIAKKKVKK